MRQAEVAENALPFLLLVIKHMYHPFKNVYKLKCPRQTQSQSLQKQFLKKKKLNPQTNKTQQENPHTQNGVFKFNTRKASGYPNFVHGEGFRQRGVQKFSLVHQVKLRIHSLSYTE